MLESRDDAYFGIPPPPSGYELLTCESDGSTASNNLENTLSTDIEPIQNAPSGSHMAISSLWGVFAEVGGYWQSVSSVRPPGTTAHLRPGANPCLRHFATRRNIKRFFRLANPSASWVSVHLYAYTFLYKGIC